MQEYTPLAIILSASVVLFVGVIGWSQSRKRARQQATFTLLLEREHDHREDFLAVWLLINSNADFAALATKLPAGQINQPWEKAKKVENLPIDQQKWLAVQRCLVYYETVSTAILKKVVDKTIVRECLGEKMVFYFASLYPFIEALRSGQKMGSMSIYKDLQSIAVEWGAEIELPLNVNSETPYPIEKLIYRLVIPQIIIMILVLYVYTNIIMG